MKEQVVLGEQPTKESERDAVHVAVSPEIAAIGLQPGQHVGFLDDGTVSPISKIKVGIVDPFLRHWVLPGEMFWLCLYPKTVTSLRHNWTSPVFDRSKK